MKLIVLRGIPGTGKSAVASIIQSKISRTEILAVDQFKVAAMKEGLNFKQAIQVSYKKGIERLKELNHSEDADFVILEEILCDKNFFVAIQKLVEENGITTYWFKLERSFDLLLEVEKGRTRKVKNSLLDLQNLKKEVDAIQIQGEETLINEDLKLTVQQILDSL